MSYRWINSETNGGNPVLSLVEDRFLLFSQANIGRCHCDECRGRIRADVTHEYGFERDYFDSWAKAVRWVLKNVEYFDEVQRKAEQR